MARMFGRRASPLLALCVPALLCGCAVGPDFVKPSAPGVSGYTPEPLAGETASASVADGAAQRFVAGLDIPGQWWRLFHSEALSALIAEALKVNPNLQAAQSALQVAQENVAAQQGAYYPSVSGNFSASRQKNPTAVLSPTLTSGSPYFNLFTPQLSVSYVPDVFGLNRRTVEGLVAQAEAQRYALAATYLTLTSNVAAAAVQEAGLRGQIKATEDIIALERELLELFRVQLSKGQIAEVDVAAQEAALAAAETALPPLQKQLAQQRDLLAALTGRFPSEVPGETFELSGLELPQELPLSLPAQVVEQRPDVLQAEANLHQASAAIGVAVANRLPNLTLSAGVGTTAAQANRLFTTGTGFWSIAASLTQPIFDGGTLLHKERAARAAFEQSVAEYRATVITAMQNVADSLRALQYDAEALKAAAHAETTAARSLELVRAQLRLGAVNYLALLNAQTAYQQAVIGLVQAQAARLADTAALFQALGGGWWNPPPAPESEGAATAGMREENPAGDRGWLLDAVARPFGF
ncbi:MAG TPA: efflux transporter outer membrane subunit [Stellaceae bacterium]|nr:efflux transporter outer membrane subunit [Stellaceae bacterium]